MRRVARLMFAVCSAISLVLCLAVCVLWVRSHARKYELAQWHFTHMPRADACNKYFVQVSWHSGTLGFRFDRERFAPAYFRYIGGDRAAQFPSFYRPGVRWHFEGPWESLERSDRPRAFDARRYVDTREPGRRADRVFLGVPHWTAAAVLAVLPAVWLYRLRRTRRTRRLGLCTHCGYDLRASPERCPECGTPAAPATVRRR